MKILLVHKFFHKTGGAEVFFFNVGNLLEKHGHEVAYFSTLDQRNQESEYSSYFTKAPAFNSGRLLIRILSIGKIVYSFKAKKKIKKLISDFKPDIVHAFAIFTHISPSVLDACREAGVPVVMSCNDYKHICPNYKLFHHGTLCEDCKDFKFYRAVVNRCCHNSFVYSMASSLESYIHHKLNLIRKNIHTFLFSSEFMVKKTSEFWGEKNFRWRIFRNPFSSIDYSTYDNTSDYILFFGRFVEEKGVEILLRAMNDLPKIKLIIVGDGPDRYSLESISKEKHLKNTNFVGPKWGKPLDRLLQGARFIVIPSIWHENFPYVILQAFAKGKPVIGTDRGGIPELIKHGKYGLIYPALNSKALKECIKYLWDSPNLAIEMGKAAKEYVEQEFSEDKTYQELIEIYREILK